MKSRMKSIVQSVSALALVFVVATLGAAEPKVKLITAGSGMKSKLRYAPEVKSTQLIRMEYAQSVKTDKNRGADLATELPKMSIRSEITVKEIDKDGNIHWDQKVLGVESATDGTGQAELLGGMLDPLKGQTISTVMSPRGVVIESKGFDLGEGSVSGMEQFAQGANVVFPEEEVGVGAQWSVRQIMDQAMMSVNVVSTYELLEKKGNVLRLKLTVEGSAPTQDLNAGEGAPPQMKTTLDRLAMNGSGEVRLDLTKMSPLSAEQKAETKSLIYVHVGDQKISMDQTMTVESKVSEIANEQTADKGPTVK